MVNGTDENPHIEANQSQPPTPGTMSAIAVKIPPFWAESPEIWFAQVEARFASNKITGDTARFNLVMSSIETNILQQVSEAVLHPPNEGKYANLKAAIIKRYSDSTRRKLSKLLNEMSLGDKRPSHFLNEMSHLAAGNLDNEMLKTVWLNALPEDMRKILSASDSTTTSIERLAATADSIQDASQRGTISAVNNGDSLVKAIEALTKRIEVMETRGRPQHRARSHSRGRSERKDNRSSSKSSDNSSTCWFHRNYGSDSRRCRSPCNFNQKSSKSGEQ